MKLRIFFAFFILAFSYCTTLSAQTVHAIIIGDTTDGTIGDGIKGNLVKIEAQLKVMESSAGITVKRYPVVDANFNCKSIRQAVETLAPGADDAVLFYYAGHGFRRDSTQTTFPEFDCRRSADPDQAQLSWVTSTLLDKKPRLIIALADTCNFPVAPQPAPAAAPLNSPENRKAGLRRLFLTYRGMLTMSGAVPGQYSYYYNTGAGGFFTNQFLAVLDQQTNTKGDLVHWEEIAAAATQKIYIPTIPTPTEQLPQSSALNLSYGN